MINIREDLNRVDKLEVYNFLCFESHQVDKSHQLMKEDMFKLHFPELYDTILSDERLNVYPVFKQKLWHFFNDDYGVHTCPVCQSELKFKSLKIGYQEHCSDKCRFSDENYREKVRKNTKKNWENMSNRDEVCEKISKGRKLSWDRCSDDVKKLLTQPMRDVLKTVNENRSDEEWEEITRKRVESYKKTCQNKTDEEKWDETDRRVKSYLETVNNRSDEEREQVSQKIKDGLRNMSGDEIRTREENLHRAKLRNVRKIRPDVIDIFTPDGSKNTIYTCKCTNEGCDKCVERVYKTTSSSYRYRKENGIETCPISHPRNIGISGGEKELLEFIRKIYKGRIVENDRSLLGGLEIDIYLPEFGVGFEFQGDLWHANPLFFDESFIHPVNGKTYGEIHEKDEHKKILAKEKGVLIIEIWENDWVENNRKTRKMIRDILEKSVR